MEGAISVQNIYEQAAIWVHQKYEGPPVGNFTRAPETRTQGIQCQPAPNVLCS